MRKTVIKSTENSSSSIVACCNWSHGRSGDGECCGVRYPKTKKWMLYPGNICPYESTAEAKTCKGFNK